MDPTEFFAHLGQSLVVDPDRKGLLAPHRVPHAGSFGSIVARSEGDRAHREVH